MYSDEDLDSAVAARILTPEAAAAFRAHVSGTRSTPAVDEEHFRLVTGFNDVFVVIAAALLLTSVAWIGTSAKPWIGALAVAATAWALAEFFVRKRRMALPAIVLLIAFVAGAFFTCLLFLDKSVEINAAAAGFVAATAAWLHWQRFRVPITVAAGAATVVIGTIAVLVLVVPAARDWISPLLFVAGVAVFAFALRWDASDVRRETRRSDIAFWLHLLAAPLLVHPVFKAIGMLSDKATMAQALLAAAMYIAIALVSLAVDRRALMVSALAYVLYVFTELLHKTGVVSLAFALTALVIGSALLLLSAFWQRSRAITIQWFPPSILTRLPPGKIYP